MKTLSLKLDEEIFLETEEIISTLNTPRNRYINEALHQYNILKKRSIIADMLRKESKEVRKESMKVLSEFVDLEEIDD